MKRTAEAIEKLKKNDPEDNERYNPRAGLTGGAGIPSELKGAPVPCEFNHVRTPFQVAVKIRDGQIIATYTTTNAEGTTTESRDIYYKTLKSFVDALKWRLNI